MSLSQALDTAVSGLRVRRRPGCRSSPPMWRTRRRRAMSARRCDQTDDRGRRSRRRRPRRRDQSRARPVRAAPAARRDLRRRLCRSAAQILSAAAADLRRSRLASSLETVFNNFTSALQALATSPRTIRRRAGVLNSAQVLAQQLNGMTADIQGLRSDAELGLADAVHTANEAMQSIAQINQQLGGFEQNDGTTRAAARPARRLYRSACAVDGHPRHNDSDNQVKVFTNSGIQLVGHRPRSCRSTRKAP